MIWDERHLGPVWTHTEALGRVFGRFYFYMHAVHIWIQFLRYSDTDMGYRSVIKIQWYRYGIQLSYRDTVIQIWDTDSWDTDEIQAFGARLSTHRGFGPCAWHFCFCPLGTRLCMHRYNQIWDSISLSIRVAPERDVTQIVRHCPSVEVRIWRDYFPDYPYSSGVWRYPDNTSLLVRWSPDMTRLFPWVLVWW